MISLINSKEINSGTKLPTQPLEFDRLIESLHTNLSAAYGPAEIEEPTVGLTCKSYHMLFLQRGKPAEVQNHISGRDGGIEP